MSLETSERLNKQNIVDGRRERASKVFDSVEVDSKLTPTELSVKGGSPRISIEGVSRGDEVSPRDGYH